MDPGQKNNVASDHPQVVEKLLADFEKYWERVIPDDRSFPAPIVGTPNDEETLLSISELRDGARYAHGHIAEGREAKGVWHIEVAEEGTYEFEVRRWPVEAVAPFQGVPKVEKRVDAWSARGAVTTFLTSGKMTALPVGAVTLKVGAISEERPVSASDEACLFKVKLPKGKVTVDAAFLDNEGKHLAAAYYVYVRKQ